MKLINNNFVRSILTGLIFISLASQSVFAQSSILHSEDVQNKSNGYWQSPIKSIGNGPLFFLDYTNLRGVANETLVEFYFQVGFDELQFIKQSERFQAAYDLEFLIYDQENNVIENSNMVDLFEVDSYSETLSQQKTRSLLVGYSCVPGKYRIKATITDLETEKQSKIEDLILVSSFQSQNLMISDIQLSSKIEPVNSTQKYNGIQSYYVKNQRYIEPNAGRVFAHGLTDICLYFEVYNLAYSQNSDHSTYTTYFIFHNHEGEKIVQFHRRNVKPGTTSAHSLKIPLHYFSKGKYWLTLSVRDDATGQTAETSRSFTVLDSLASLSQMLTHDEL